MRPRNELQSLSSVSFVQDPHLFVGQKGQSLAMKRGNVLAVIKVLDRSIKSRSGGYTKICQHDQPVKPLFWQAS